MCLYLSDCEVFYKSNFYIPSLYLFLDSIIRLNINFIIKATLLSHFWVFRGLSRGTKVAPALALGCEVAAVAVAGWGQRRTQVPLRVHCQDTGHWEAGEEEGLGREQLCPGVRVRLPAEP